MAPLEIPGPPPPPPPPPPPLPPPVAEAVEARYDPDEDGRVEDLGDVIDCTECACCWAPDWSEVKDDEVGIGEGLFRWGKREVDVRTAEKDEVNGEVVDPVGPGLWD